MHSRARDERHARAGGRDSTAVLRGTLAGGHSVGAAASPPRGGAARAGPGHAAPVAGRAPVAGGAVQGLHRPDAQEVPDAAGDAALRHGEAARLPRQGAHAARVRRHRPAQATTRGIPARVHAARRTGPGGLGTRREGAGAWRRAPAVGLRHRALVEPRDVGRIHLRFVGALAAALAGAGGRVLRRQHPAVALRQPQDGGAGASRRRRALPPTAAGRLVALLRVTAAVHGAQAQPEGPCRARHSLRARALPRGPRAPQRGAGQRRIPHLPQ